MKRREEKIKSLLHMTLDTKGKIYFMSCVAKAWDIGEGLFVCLA